MLFDGAAMVAAMCWSIFKQVKHRLGTWKKSKKRLRMANGDIVPSKATQKRIALRHKKVHVNPPKDVEPREKGPSGSKGKGTDPETGEMFI